MEKIQEKIQKQKGLTQYSNEELQYIQKPIDQALYKSQGRPKKIEKNKAKWNDKIKCDRCGKIFIRSSRTAHYKTQYHKIFDKMNNKLQNILLSK